MGLVLLALGIALSVAGVVGFFRLPEATLRLKALALVTTPAAVCIHVATAVMVPSHHGMRGLVTALLFLLSGPMLGQTLLLAARQEPETPADEGEGRLS